MRRRIEAAVATGLMAIWTLTGCSDSEEDKLRDIEQAAPTGIWLAPYAFHYLGSDRQIHAAVRPFAEVDGKFSCRPVGAIGAASAMLYAIDGSRLVEFEQPETEGGLIRQFETIGRETLHCVAFDEKDTYQTLQIDNETYKIPSIGSFPDGKKIVGQSTTDLSGRYLEPIP